MAERKYDDGQRREVLARVDRGETIRSASLAAGVSPDAGYRWAKQAGLSNPRSSPRSYTAEEKALFLRRLAEVGDVSPRARVQPGDVLCVGAPGWRVHQHVCR